MLVALQPPVSTKLFTKNDLFLGITSVANIPPAPQVLLHAFRNAYKSIQYIINITVSN